MDVALPVANLVTASHVDTTSSSVFISESSEVILVTLEYTQQNIVTQCMHNIALSAHLIEILTLVVGDIRQEEIPAISGYREPLHHLLVHTT